MYFRVDLYCFPCIIMLCLEKGPFSIPVGIVLLFYTVGANPWGVFTKPLFVI